jgi:hypothetical protein
MSANFSQMNTCDASLAPGPKCAIKIKFRPTAKELRTGTLTIKDNAPQSAQTVSLQGTGEGTK